MTTCESFSMRTDSYYVEDGGRPWVLHVFDVDGEDDVFGITLMLADGGTYVGFLREFQQCLELVRASHPDAPLCEACRPRVGLRWMPAFSDWVKAAYAAMSHPPSPVDEVPDVVRLSFESLVKAAHAAGEGEDPPVLS